ncbi:MAG TPA: serine/threonine-protein kinase [Polyangiaceae bacterium]|nr:serine/threonine-protein kinase [Polyangiaceae bacterium]
MRPSETAARARAAAGSPAADGSFVGKCLQGRYRIEAPLGAGGVGKVYRARHLALDRSVALKVLRKQHNEHWGSRQRFEREARALGTLTHPHIVAVTDFGIEEDVPFLVMELLEGESLESRLRAGPLEAELAHRCARELLAGLAFVHERGLVHRDVKPGNIFLARTEQGSSCVKLLDFGLAKLVVTANDAQLTRSGEVFGTPAYMAPEQVTGEASDARTDVYAAGLVLFEMFAGRRPFVGGDSELLRQQLLEPLPRLGDVRHGVQDSERLDSLLSRATHKEKKQRFASAGEMAAALEAIVPRQAAGKARPPRASRRPSPVGGVLRAGALLVCGVALAAIVLAGGVIYLLGSPDGASHRVLLKRALAPLLDEPAAPAR